MITQIYEIQTVDEAGQCLACGVDHIGSVLENKADWKQQALKDVVVCTQAGGAKHSLIPLFSEYDRIANALEYYAPDFVHLCDNLTRDSETVGAVESLIVLQQKIKHAFSNIKIMRSIPIAPKGVAPGLPFLELVRLFELVSDVFLIDTWASDNVEKGFVGITGQTVDWDQAAELIVNTKIPVILAGGLSADNVADAILKVKPWGVDSCTRTNVIDEQGKPIRFKKDFEKVKKFVQGANGFVLPGGKKI